MWAGLDALVDRTVRSDNGFEPERYALPAENVAHQLLASKRIIVLDDACTNMMWLANHLPSSRRPGGEVGRRLRMRICIMVRHGSSGSSSRAYMCFASESPRGRPRSHSRRKTYIKFRRDEF